MKAAWRACALLAAVLAAPVHAQEFPTKQITVFLVLAPGTGLDAVARTWGEQLSQSLGKPVVFDNRPGAGGIIAVTALKNQPADGHALLVATSGALAINQTSYKQLPYSPQELFPVSIYLKSPFILVVHPSLPVKSARDLVDFAKARPGQLSYSSPSGAGAPRLASELFIQTFGLAITHVPYKNSPQSISDIAAGHVQLGFVEAGASKHLIQAKRLRPLAVSSLTRFESLPEVPTLAEATARPGLEAVSWHALVAISSTPRPVINRLHAEMTRIMKIPEVRERVANIGLIPIDPLAIEAGQQYVASETKKWGDLIRSLGLAGSL